MLAKYHGRFPKNPRLIRQPENHFNIVNTNVTNRIFDLAWQKTKPKQIRFSLLSHSKKMLNGNYI